jgi:hypothetical protein
MNIYLAGTLTAGNLKNYYDIIMKLYLAGTYSRPFIFDNAMKLYIEGIQGKAKDFVIKQNNPYILESYFYIKDQNNWVTERHHLAVNSAWEVNNIVPHSAENMSPNWRIHLLIDLIDEDILNNQSDLMSQVIPHKENSDLDIAFQQNTELEKWTLSKVAENFNTFTGSTS